jgi:UPF0755 protein
MNKLVKIIVNNKWYLFLAIIVIALVLKGYYTYAQYQEFLISPLNITENTADYTVKPGATMRNIARDLGELGLLKEPTFLVVRARMRKLAQSIKVGEYNIQKGTLPDQLLDQFVKGKVKQYSLTLIEGWSFREVMAALNQHPQIRHTLIDKTAEQIMQAIGHEGEHPEGRFFPETYRFPINTSDAEFLKRAYRHMDNYLNKAWQTKAQGLPLENAYEALILASIIEKETAQKSEYREIAGVFTRRLKIGMRLQTDPTVIYGLGLKFDGNLTRKHLRQDTPYNTYTRKGLPPTPIAIPGAAAIDAALHPAEGKTLYFVAKGNGEHHFSRTLKEHNEAVIRYQLKGDRTKGFSSRPRVAQ